MNKDYIQYEKYSKEPFIKNHSVKDSDSYGSIFKWFFDGRFHRIGGFCYLSTSERSYCRYGKLHRLNAPAIFYPSSKEYWEFGNQLK